MPLKVSILNVLSGECPAINTICIKPRTNITLIYQPDINIWTRQDEFNT